MSKMWNRAWKIDCNQIWKIECAIDGRRSTHTGNGKYEIVGGKFYMQLYMENMEFMVEKRH